MTTTTAADEAAAQSKKAEIQTLRELIMQYEWRLDCVQVELGAYQKSNRPIQLLEEERIELNDRLNDLKRELESLENPTITKQKIQHTQSVIFPLSSPPMSPGGYSAVPLSPHYSLNLSGVSPQQPHPHTPLQNAAMGSSTHTSASQAAPVIHVNLPHGQHTKIHPARGKTLFKALKKAMKQRDLDYVSCNVYTISIVNNNDIRVDLDWNTDSSHLAGDQIYVELKEHYQRTRTIHHNFVRKTFYLAFCDVCRNPLINGYKCQTCEVKFHQKCSAKVPIHCTLFGSENYFKDLLAQRIPLVNPAAGISSQDDTNRPKSPFKRRYSTNQFKSTSTPSFANWSSKKQESFDMAETSESQDHYSSSETLSNADSEPYNQHSSTLSRSTSQQLSKDADFTRTRAVSSNVFIMFNASKQKNRRGKVESTLDM